jgi:DNA-binding IclR family transcriptional regulator
LNERCDDHPSAPGALRRGLQILTLLRRSEGVPLSPAQIASALSIPRPTVYRVLTVLESESYVRRTGDGRKFFIEYPEHGESITLLEHMRTVMRAVAAHTGNAVFLVKREGPELVCLHREIGTHPLQVLSMQVGARAPLGVGAAGVAMLSVLPEAERSDVLATNAASYVEYGNLQVSTIRKLVENCGVRGYAVVGNYMLKGVLSVGITLEPQGSVPLMAMSVTGPHERLPLVRQKQVADFMRNALNAINGNVLADMT